MSDKMQINCYVTFQENKNKKEKKKFFKVPFKQKTSWEFSVSILGSALGSTASSHFGMFLFPKITAQPQLKFPSTIYQIRPSKRNNMLIVQTFQKCWRGRPLLFVILLFFSS